LTAPLYRSRQRSLMILEQLCPSIAGHRDPALLVACHTPGTDAQEAHSALLHWAFEHLHKLTRLEQFQLLALLDAEAGGEDRPRDHLHVRGENPCDEGRLWNRRLGLTSFAVGVEQELD